MLDSCALLIAVIDGPASRQAQLTFAMARHALVDLGHVFHIEEHSRQWLQRGETNRLPPEAFRQLCTVLAQSNIRLCGDDAAAIRLHAMRTLYEPHACALSDYLGMTLPGWFADPNAKDQWIIIDRLRQQAEIAIAHGRTLSDDTAHRILKAESHEH